MATDKQLKHFYGLFSLFFGVVLIVVMLVLAILFPYPTDYQANIFRMVISLAFGGIVATFSGRLNVRARLGSAVLSGGGGMAGFLIVYLFNPPSHLSEPVSQISPAVGLANGYYYNFLVPLIEGLDNDLTPVMGDSTMARNYRFDIFIPDDATLSKLDAVKDLVKDRVRKIEFEIPSKNRRYTFYIPNSCDRIDSAVFVDIPSTIYTIIKYGDDLKESRDDVKLNDLYVQEIMIFRNTLKDLLRKDLVMSRRCRVLNLDIQNLPRYCR